jgi:SAM-dependent methyltransferase
MKESRKAMHAQEMTSEEYNLRLSWDCHPLEYLDRYLVSGVQDPRINGQSILTRALLIDALHPGRCDALITEELRFGAVLTWILRQLENGSTPYEILDAMNPRCPARIPEVVLTTYAWLQDDACPVPDYITAALSFLNDDTPGQMLPDLALDTFMTIWREQLSQTSAAPISVLEAACGSANDYRFLHRCGVARFLRYTGIDIASRNIANAKRRYPNADFQTRSILTTGLPDSSFDYLFCHDLIEHLSPASMERALTEMLRIAHTKVILHFFNAKATGDHEIVPIRRYYRSRVSMEKIAALFQRLGAPVTCLRMTEWFQEKTGFSGYHNPNAFSMIIAPAV